jgi:hypothetical protein
MRDANSRVARETTNADSIGYMTASARRLPARKPQFSKSGTLPAASNERFTANIPADIVTEISPIAI